MSGPFDRWPTGDGFEKFYGFLGGDTNQYTLIDGVMPIDPPKSAEEGYHLSEDVSASTASTICARAAEGEGYRIHLAGFAAYVSLVGYLLVRSLEETPWSLAAYVVAVMCHFLAIDHALREERGAAFDRTGRFVLAAACVLGWGAGLLLAVPPFVVALVLAFVSGAVIMNSAIMERPSEKDGRFWLFVIVGLAYALLLLPLS